MKISIDRADDLQNKLENLQKKAKSLDGDQKVPIIELFPVVFMNRHTEYHSIEEMMSEGEIDFESTNEIHLESDNAWNAFVSKHTEFKNWTSMLEKAVEEYFSKKLRI